MNTNPTTCGTDGAPSLATKGFALVVTLNLMVLLSILALGLLSLSSVSLRQSNSLSSMNGARANARMALMLAIGELQQQLGPDKRINTNASQLSDDAGESSSAAAGRRHWMGVYDSWDSTSTTPRPAPQFRKWLVSGESAVLSVVDAAKTSSTDDVTLWQGTSADGSDHVSVPLVKVRKSGSATSDGGYAWWVGDENSKAMIAKRPNTGNQLADAMSNTQASPATAYHLNPALSGIDRDAEAIGRLASLRSIDLLAANPEASAETFHDFTSNSVGVIADVARGGLKRDLSLFLDHPVSKAVAVKLPNEHTVSSKGITWEELWLFHNAWRALEPPVAGLSSMTGGDLTNSLIMMTKPGQGAASVSAFRSDPFSIYKVPNFIRSQWMLSLWAKEKPGTTPMSYSLFWVTDGITTLWNPLDVPIALHPDAYMSFKYWNIPYTIRISDATGTVAENSFSDVAGGGGHSFTMLFGTAPDPYWGRYGTPDPVVLMPGEVLVMSEGPGNGDPIPYSGDQADRTLAMKAGWNLGRGRSVAVNLKTGKTVTAASNLKFEAFANTNNSSTGVVNQHFSYGADVRGGSPSASLYEAVGGRQVVPSDGSRANTHTDMFPPITGALPSVETMVGSGKHPFMLFSHQAKTEDSPTWLSGISNPRFTRAKFTTLDPLEQAMSGHEIQADGLSGSEDSKMPQFSVTQINRGLFGGSYWDLSRGQDTVVTMSVPREPPVSLGAFQHAIANGITNRSSGGALKGDLDNLTKYVRPEVSHAISNSYALPVLGPSQTESSNYHDHSYQTNRMLWDSWFLSSIVQQQSPHHTAKRTAKQVYSDFVEKPESHLPNSHMRSWVGDTTTAINALFASTGLAKADAFELASSKLMVEGAFNVNSTSVEAWKAVLGALDEAFIPVVDGINEPAALNARKVEHVPIVSNLVSFGNGSGAESASFEGSDVTTATNPAQWRGYRKLNHDEIAELAEALVKEIRIRGPFLSLADFINRRPSNDKELALCGPLQAALDRTVNKSLFSASERIGTAPAEAGYPFEETAKLPKSMSTPNHILQADILTPIGSQLTVRSDTFRIRAYGEARDEKGKVTATAWCEALVQRLPEYIDPIDPPQAADPSPDTEPRTIAKLKSQSNKDLGRRIKVTSFRWLTSSDIKS